MYHYAYYGVMPLHGYVYRIFAWKRKTLNPLKNKGKRQTDNL